MTPVGLLFAGRVTSDRCLFKPTTPATPLTDAASFVAEHRDLQDKLLSNVKSPVRVDSIHDDPAFKLHDWVMLAPPVRPVDKLAPKLQGPYKVTQVQGNVIDLFDSNTSLTRRVYADRLRRWIAAPGVDPLKEAAKTHNTEYIVEKIIAHRRHPGKKGKLTTSKCQFKVKWQDFTETTWERFSHVKDTAALDTYLASTPLS